MVPIAHSVTHTVVKAAVWLESYSTPPELPNKDLGCLHFLVSVWLCACFHGRGIGYVECRDIRSLCFCRSLKSIFSYITSYRLVPSVDVS